MDLHDQTLADLTRLTRRLERLTERAADGPAALAEAIEPVARGLHHCMQDLRQIIETAEPSVLAPLRLCRRRSKTIWTARSATAA